jgi:hypothetical protein
VLAAARNSASIATIAAQLALSESTIRNHLSTIIQKLDVHNRVEAARLAEQKGWRKLKDEQITSSRTNAANAAAFFKRNLLTPGRFRYILFSIIQLVN